MKPFHPLTPLLLVALGAGTTAVSAQQPAPQFPVQKTLNGVTVSVLSARWATRGEVFPRNGQGGAADKGLVLTYRVSDSRAGVSPQFLGPDGQPIPNLTPQTVADASGGKAFVAGLDPRLPTFNLGFEWLDPAAPPEASGHDAETLDFAGLPVPDTPGRAVAVDRALTTGHGTRVTLLKVGVQGATPDGGPAQTLFVLRCLPPPAVPDLYASLFFAYPGLFDDRGRNLMTNASYGASSEDPLDHTPGTVTLSVAAVPSPQAKTLDLKVSVHEDAPSLRQERWYRRVQFALPVASLPGLGASGPYAPLATAASGTVQSTLESLRSPSRGQYEARLWLADGYDFQNIALHDDVGGDYSAVDESDDGTPLFWRSNGAPIQPGKRGHRLGFYAFPVKQAPSKLSISVDVRPVRRVRHVFDLADLPIPPPGGTLAVDKTVQDAEGGRLTVRAVSYFTDDKPLPGMDAPTRAQVAPASGLALVVRFQSAAPPANGGAATAQFSCQSAADDQGHSLTGRHGLTASSADWLQASDRAATTPANTETTLLLPPAAGSAPGRFRVRMQVDETVPGGPSRKLVFRDLPAPAPRP